MALVTVEGLRLLAYGLVVDRNVMGFVKGVTFRVARADLPVSIFALHETCSLDVIDDELAISGLFRLVESHQTPNHYVYRFTYVERLSSASPDALVKALDQRMEPQADKPDEPARAEKKNTTKL